MISKTLRAAVVCFSEFTTFLAHTSKIPLSAACNPAPLPGCGLTAFRALLSCPGLDLPWALCSSVLINPRPPHPTSAPRWAMIWEPGPPPRWVAGPQDCFLSFRMLISPGAPGSQLFEYLNRHPVSVLALSSLTSSVTRGMLLLVSAPWVDPSPTVYGARQPSSVI